MDSQSIVSYANIASVCVRAIIYTVIACHYCKINPDSLFQLFAITQLLTKQIKIHWH